MLDMDFRLDRSKSTIQNYDIFRNYDYFYISGIFFTG